MNVERATCQLENDLDEYQTMKVFQSKKVSKNILYLKSFCNIVFVFQGQKCKVSFYIEIFLAKSIFYSLLLFSFSKKKFFHVYVSSIKFFIISNSTENFFGDLLIVLARRPSVPFRCSHFCFMIFEFYITVTIIYSIFQRNEISEIINVGREKIELGLPGYNRF